MPFTPEAENANFSAYVIKVRGDAQPDALSGRLENFVSGKVREFASSEELLRLIAADLAAAAELKP